MTDRSEIQGTVERLRSAFAQAPNPSLFGLYVRRSKSADQYGRDVSVYWKIADTRQTGVIVNCREPALLSIVEALLDEMKELRRQVRV